MTSALRGQPGEFQYSQDYREKLSQITEKKKIKKGGREGERGLTKLETPVEKGIR